jgi:cell division protease FtsH
MSSPTVPSKPTDQKVRPRLRPPTAALWMIALLVLFLAFVASRWLVADTAEIKYTFFYQQLLARNIKSLEIRGQKAYGEFIVPPPSPTASQKPADRSKSEAAQAAASPRRLPKKFVVNLLSPEVDAELRKSLIDAGVEVTSRPPTDYSQVLLLVWLGLLAFLLIGGWTMARRARDQVLGGGMLSGVLRSPARRYEAEQGRVTFNDVAGLTNGWAPACPRACS